MAIAIYARKSIEKENSISCETQIDYCRAMIYLQFSCRGIAPSAYLVAADCVMMVPSDLGWNPNEQNLSPAKTKGELIARVFVQNHSDYFGQDFSAITKDLSLPDTAYKNQLNAVISYSADQFEGREVISPDGIVTRPYATAQGDADIQLYVNASYRDDQNQEQTGSYAIPVTVKKWNKYEITKPLSFDLETLQGGKTVTAYADVNVHVGGEDSGRAVLVLVLYDASGKVIGMSMGESQGNGEMTVNASIKLPENISGAKLRAYLINGFENANRLSNSIEIKG